MQSVKLDQKFKVFVQVALVAFWSERKNVLKFVQAVLTLKRSIVQVRNENDQMCLAKCFLIASAFRNGGFGSPDYLKATKSRIYMKKEAKKLFVLIGLLDREMSMNNIPKFDEVFIENHSEPTFFKKGFS